MHTESQQSSWTRNLLLSLFSILFVWLILEISLRSFDAYRGLGFFSGHRNLFIQGKHEIKPFKMFGFDLYKEKDGQRYISSRHGELFPLQKSADTFRIAVLGGSTTENGYANRIAGIHYPLVLQNELRKAFNTDKIEVINLGNSAYATPHSMILLELDVLSWQPDMIIVSHNINDLTVSYWPNFTYDYSNKYSHPFFTAMDHNDLSTINALFQHSTFYWFVYDKIKMIKGNVPMKRKSMGMDLPLASKEVFKRNLQNITRLAKANGIKVVLGNQALESSEEYFKLHMDFKPYNDLVSYPLQEEFVNHHHIFNDIIRQVAEENQVTFVDNSKVMNDKTEYFVDLVHYTPKGVEVLGKNYAASILNARIVSLPPATP